MVFLHTSNEQHANEWNENNSFYNIKKNKILKSKFNKKVQDFFSADIIKKAIFPKLSYSSKAITIKIPAVVFTEIGIWIPKIPMKMQKTHLYKKKTIKKEQSWKIGNSWFQNPL